MMIDDWELETFCPADDGIDVTISVLASDGRYYLAADDLIHLRDLLEDGDPCLGADAATAVALDLYATCWTALDDGIDSLPTREDAICLDSGYWAIEPAL